MMLAGAFGGVAGSDLGGVGTGIVVGIACGVLVAVIQALSSITLGADQIVVGIALNITAIGVTSFLARTIWEDGNVPQVSHLSPLDVPGLGDIPFVGEVLFHQNALVYVAGGLAVGSWWALTRTGWGLRLRACGEDPRSADSLGIPVFGMRWQSMLICGALAGLGGVFLSLGEIFTFSDSMSGGRGFIALAVVIVARWSPLRAVLGALLFGLCEAVAFRVQAEGVGVPYELMLALPYVVTLLVYAGVVGRTVAPAALGRNYVRR
jgi:simple sugar transport system permease protein